MLGIGGIGLNGSLAANTSQNGKVKNRSDIRKFLEEAMIDANEEQHIRKLKNNEDSKNITPEEETGSETFVNSKGERILAIKTAFGVRYIKIGEVTDFLLSDNKNSANIETILGKTY